MENGARDAKNARTAERHSPFDSGPPPLQPTSRAYVKAYFFAVTRSMTSSRCVPSTGFSMISDAVDSRFA